MFSNLLTKLSFYVSCKTSSRTLEKGQWVKKKAEKKKKNRQHTKEKNNMKIFTGNANPDFAKKVAKHLNVSLGDCEVSHFADGEIRVSIKENVRGSDVFIIQSTCAPVNEHYMELFILMDAIKRASAREITLVMPYYGYARQDRKAEPRAPISARCVADLCQSAGANRLLVVDLHAPQIQGFFNGPVDNLFAFPVMAQAWKEKKKDMSNLVCVSPDAGAMERTRAFAERIKSPIAVIDKKRDKANTAKAFHVIGDIKNKTALIIDDMIDTAGTLCVAVDQLIQNGAKEVYAIVTHAVFSGPALERIEKSHLKEVWVTDTIPKKRKSDKIHCVSVASLVATAMKRIHSKGSVSALFD